MNTNDIIRRYVVEFCAFISIWREIQLDDYSLLNFFSDCIGFNPGDGAGLLLPKETRSTLNTDLVGFMSNGDMILKYRGDLLHEIIFVTQIYVPEIL